MTDTAAEVRAQTRLRRAAESLLAEGQAPPSRGWELGTDALALLYRLASDVDSSDDALAVLHELQVHQVELDLQLEQLEANEEELTAELQRYRNLYELAPVAFLRISPEGRMLDGNEAGRRLLASLHDDHEVSADGLRIVDLIEAEDRPVLTAMLERLGADEPIVSAEVRAAAAPAAAERLRIKARLEWGSDNVWLAIV